MTEEQINKIKFHMVSHMSMDDCHISLYEASNLGFELLMKVSTPVGEYQGKKRSTLRFFYKQKWITKSKLIKELLDKEV